ncbi:MAG: ABC transporter permease [Acidobacteria bacterium]|nr:ABC transporter permease [Acidobacteriota bacterium]
MSNISYIIRSMLRTPCFTIGAILTFALSIGSNVAVFSAVDRMLVRPLPYRNPGEIVLMGEFGPGMEEPAGSVPAAYVTECRRLKSVLDACVCGSARSYSTSRETDAGTEIWLTEVSFNTLAVFGVRPFMGRDFTEQDAITAQGKAIISYDLWRGLFGREADILRRRLWFNDRPVEIIGVLPQGFIIPTLLPGSMSNGLALDFDTLRSYQPGQRRWAPFLRLRAGVPASVAEAEIRAVVESLRKEEAALQQGTGAPVLRLIPVRTALFGRYGRYVWLVAGAAVLVLLVACANLTCLMLVRGRYREQHMAVRAAVGASPLDLMQLALMEIFAIVFVGATIGFLAVVLTNKGLQIVMPAALSRYSASPTDLRVIGFSVLAIALSTLFAGLSPSLRLAKASLISTLQGVEAYSHTGRLRGGSALLMVEAGVSALLVTGAMLTTINLIGLLRTNLGYQPEGLYHISIALPSSEGVHVRYLRYMQLLEEVRKLPGVESAGAATVLPTSGAVGDRFATGVEERAYRWEVTDGFFETMGMQLVAGRSFRSADLDGPDNVGILSSLGLRLIWPNLEPAEAIGRMLALPGEAPRQIIGIVSDLRASYFTNPWPALYVPVNPEHFRRLEFVARADARAGFPLSELRRRVRQSAGALVTMRVSYVPETLHRGLLNQRFLTLLFSVFGVVAMLLATVGLYAVQSFEVARRRREMGVRLALGSTGSQLRRLVIREQVQPALLGILVGLVGAYWAAELLRPYLYQINARDLRVYVGVALLHLAVATIGAWLPATHAARTDPAALLRAQ